MASTPKKSRTGRETARPQPEPYTTRIIKVGALLNDTKTLLSHWDSGQSVKDNYQDPLCRKIFTNTPAFRASLFSLRSGGPSIKELTDAVQKLEDLNGEEVDVEEGVIATAFKKIASEEMEMLLPLKALAEAHKLPILGLVTDYQQTLSGIQRGLVSEQ